MGISLGGMVAVQWAMDYPSEVSGVVLLNSSFGGMSPFYRRLSPFATTLLLRAAGRRDIVEREKLIMQMVSSRPKEHWDSVQNFAKYQREKPISPLVTLRQLAAAARFNPPPTAPVHRGLILTSLGDRLAHPSCSIRIHQRWGWPIRIHPTGGHDISLDEPDWVAQQIQSWWESKE